MTPEITQVFLTHGLAGAVALLFIGLYIREINEHQKTREKASKDAATSAAEHSAELKAIYAASAAEKTTMLTQAAAQERTFFEQMNDLREAHAMRERASLQTIEFFAKAEVEAVEELGRIAQALRKAYERLRR